MRAVGESELMAFGESMTCLFGCLAELFSFVPSSDATLAVILGLLLLLESRGLFL